MTDFTYRELQECAAREVKQRERVYPKLVACERISPHFAARQVKMMEAIARHFDALADQQESEGRLI